MAYHNGVERLKQTMPHCISGLKSNVRPPLRPRHKALIKQFLVEKQICPLAADLSPGDISDDRIAVEI